MNTAMMTQLKSWATERLAGQLAALSDGDMAEVHFQWGSACGRVVRGEGDRLWLHVNDCLDSAHLLRGISGEPHRMVTAIKRLD